MHAYVTIFIGVNLSCLVSSLAFNPGRLADPPDPELILVHAESHYRWELAIGWWVREQRTKMRGPLGG